MLLQSLLFHISSVASPLMQFSFEHISYLYGLLIIIPLLALFLFAVARKKKITALMGPPHLIRPLIKNYSPGLYFIKFALPALALLLLIVAAANLRSPKEGTVTNRTGIDLVIALDISKSMWSEDVKPTRIDLARQMLQGLITKAGNNNIGIVVFAGKPYLQLPLTADIAAAQLCLYNASPDIAPVQGTNIAAALQRCADAFDSNDDKYKAIVLVSDGENHEPGLEETITRLSDAGIIVYTVGVGTAAGGTITEPGSADYKKNLGGQTIITRLNAANLQAISEGTRGGYFNLSESRKQADEVAQAINEMEQKTLASQGGGLKEYHAWYTLLIAVAIMLLVAELFIPEIKKTT